MRDDSLLVIEHVVASHSNNRWFAASHVVTKCSGRQLGVGGFE